MGFVKAILGYVLLIIVFLAVSAVGIDQLFKDQGGIGHVKTTLETIKLRTENPLMSAGKRQAVLEKLGAATSAQNLKETKTETVAVVHATGTEDLTAMDRIHAMNIPDEMKQQILRNYEANGILPEIVIREKPVVAPQVRSPADDDIFD